MTKTVKCLNDILKMFEQHEITLEEAESILRKAEAFIKNSTVRYQAVHDGSESLVDRLKERKDEIDAALKTLNRHHGMYS